MRNCILCKAPVAQDKSFAPFIANSSLYWSYNVLHIFINTARLTADAVNFKSAVVVECQALRAAPAQRHGEHGKDEDQRYL